MFTYNDPSMDPTEEEDQRQTDYYWGDENYMPVQFSIVAGQGVVIDCGEGLAVTTSGQVPTEEVSFTTVELNNFTGNPFSAPIDIQNIKISDGGAGDIGWGTENFSIWSGIPEVVEGSMFTYNDPSMDPTEEEDKKQTDYYWGDENYIPVKYPIAVGQGVVIDCGAGLTVTIEPPYTLK